MKSLINADLYRLIKFKMFYVGMFLNIFIVTGMEVVRYNIGSITNAKDYIDSLYKIFAFTLPILCFAGTFASQEFSQKIIRPIAARGVSVSKIFICQVVAGSIGSILYCVIGTGIGLALCYHYFPGDFDSYFLSKIFIVFLVELIIHIAYTVFVMMLTYLIRNGRVSMFINFALLIFFPVLLHGIMQSFNFVINLRNLWIGNIVNIIAIDISVVWLGYAIIVSIFYISICIIVSSIVGNKRDIA